MITESAGDEGGSTNFFRDLASKKIDRPSAPSSYRRNAAILLGALLGLAYGLSTQFVNSLLSPSVPFSHHPFGVVGNIAASVVGLALICLACSLTNDSYRGALLGSISFVAVLEMRALFVGTPLLEELKSLLSVFALLGLLFELVLSLPAMVALRWTLDAETEMFSKPIWSWPRLRWPLAFCVAALALGFVSLYPSDVRAAMEDMDKLISLGIAASSPSEIPHPLLNVPDFADHASHRYTIELGESTLFAQDILPGIQGNVIVVVARFQGGWTMSCLYLNYPDNPICKSYIPQIAPPIVDFRVQRPHNSV